MAAAAPALATSARATLPPMNGLRPQNRKISDLHREAFSRRALIKAILDQSFGARVSDRLQYRNTAIF
jgi:hypothetical protein